MTYTYPKFADLIGKTLVSIEQTDDKDGGDMIRIDTTDGKTYTMSHYQDCCESVYIESIVGDLSDLVGSPILVAEESENDVSENDEYGNLEVWTFYKLATVKGWVDIRWFGSSNGYYGVSVNFYEIVE